MKLKIFLAFASILTIVGAYLLGYQARNSLLLVNVGLNLHVYQESSKIPGSGWISKRNTNVTLIEWPQIASESVDLNLQHDYHTTRSTPAQFVISLKLNQTERVVTISHLTKTGSYSGSVSSLFSGVKQGKYNLTITIRVFNSTEIQDQLNRLVTIP